MILLGVREDLVRRHVATLTPAAQEIPVSLVLQGLPKLRSGLSRSVDGPDEWRSTLHEVISSGVLKTLPNGHYAGVRRAVIDGLDAIRNYRADRGGEFVPGRAHSKSLLPLQNWVRYWIESLPPVRERRGEAHRRMLCNAQSCRRAGLWLPLHRDFDIPAKPQQEAH